MKNPRLVSVVLAASVLLAWAEPVAAESSTRPPTNLKKVGDHWTPWDPPEAGPDAYIIQKGDTLWDLAGKWFQDPFLWPQIWDQNRYILDSHWVYPGDPLVVPGRPTVVPEGGLPVAEEQPPSTLPPGEVIAETAPAEPPPPPLVPMADASDLYCSGFIAHEGLTADLSIAGHDLEKHATGEGDVIFVDGGEQQGVKAGDEFAILRAVRPVMHPLTNETMGTFVRRMGRARVMIAHANNSTAVIDMSCEDIRDGDKLVPWAEIPVPMLSSFPPFDRWDPTPTGEATGHVVAVGDDLAVVGNGNLIYTDLGQLAGVTPGDVLVVYRDRTEGLPRLKLGQAVVLTVEPETSSAKILLSTRESGVGDRVEIAR